MDTIGRRWLPHLPESELCTYWYLKALCQMRTGKLEAAAVSGEEAERALTMMAGKKAREARAEKIK